MDETRPSAASSTLVTIKGPGGIPNVLARAHAPDRSNIFPALLTLARALARADAARDRVIRSAANDNDPSSDLRPL